MNYKETIADLERILELLKEIEATNKRIAPALPISYPQLDRWQFPTYPTYPMYPPYSPMYLTSNSGTGNPQIFPSTTTCGDKNVVE